MNQTFLNILFYALVCIGALLFIILLIRILFKGKEIDKSSVTWLIVAFVCIVFPVIGNLTIEYGELKISLTKISSNSEEVAVVLESLQMENQKLTNQLDELNRHINNSKNILVSQNTSRTQKMEILNDFQKNLDTLSDQSADVEQKLESASYKNRSIVEDLNSKSKRFK